MDNQKGRAEDEPGKLEEVQEDSDANYLINFLRTNKVDPAFLRAELDAYERDKAKSELLRRRFQSKTRLILTLTETLKLMRSNSSSISWQKLEEDQLENEKQVKKLAQLQQAFSTVQKQLDELQSNNPSTHNRLIVQERAFQEAFTRRTASENPDLATLQLVYNQKKEEQGTLEQELSVTNQKLQALKAQFEAFRFMPAVPAENVSTDSVESMDTNSVNDETWYYDLNF